MKKVCLFAIMITFSMGSNVFAQTIDLRDYVDVCSTGAFGSFRASFGKSFGDPNYNLAFDFDNNGSVGISDFSTFRAKAANCKYNFCQFATAFPLGAKAGQRSYQAGLDYNNDNEIGITDFGKYRSLWSELCTTGVTGGALPLE